MKLDVLLIVAMCGHCPEHIGSRHFTYQDCGVAQKVFTKQYPPYHKNESKPQRSSAILLSPHFKKSIVALDGSDSYPKAYCASKRYWNAWKKK